MCKINIDAVLIKAIDSIFIIRGNAQLAKNVDQIVWAKGYLDEIINECDNLNLLVNQVKKETEPE